MNKIHKQAERLARGEITLETFLKVTHLDWTCVARSLLRRWAAPVEVEDVVQDLCLAVVQFYPKYNSTRGVSLGKFLLFNASDKAKKQIHRYRDANTHRCADKNKSRMTICDPFTVTFANKMSEMPSADVGVTLSCLVERMPSGKSRLIAGRVVRYRGDLEAVASSVFNNPRLAKGLGLLTLSDARRLTNEIFGWMQRAATAKAA